MLLQCKCLMRTNNIYCPFCINGRRRKSDLHTMRTGVVGAPCTPPLAKQDQQDLASKTDCRNASLMQQSARSLSEQLFLLKVIIVLLCCFQLPQQLQAYLSKTHSADVLIKDMCGNRNAYIALYYFDTGSVSCQSGLAPVVLYARIFVMDTWRTKATVK